jgi:hypothetical protein
MTALGAKPNHGFFNCQHPAPGNPRARIPARCRAAPSSHAAAFAHARMRCAQASVPSKQNIFFSAVSCFTRETSADAVRHRHRHRRHPGTRRQAMNGSLNFFVRHGRFSAPHNPDCAKLRSLVGAVDGRRRASETSSTHRADGVARASDATAAHDRCGRTGGIRPWSDATTTDERHVARRASCKQHPETKKPPTFPWTASGYAPGIGAMSRGDQ